MTSVPFFLLFFAFVIAWATLRGGAPERVTAIAFVLALAATASGGFWSIPGEFRVIPVHLFVVDLVLLAALIVIAVRANRWWPIPVAGMQLVAVLVHAGRLFDPTMVPNGYAFLTTIWSWPMVAILGLGTWTARRRLATGSFVADWKPFSLQSS